MDKGARVTGLVVFAVGVGMLMWVFVMAVTVLNESRSAEITDLAQQLPREGYVLLARVLLFLVLGFVASAVAGRGIQLFESCGPDVRQGVSGEREEPQAPREEVADEA